MPFKISENMEQIDSRKERLEREMLEFKKNIVEKFSETNQEKIFDALSLMLKIHLPQADRADGLVFASHPLAVAEKVLELNGSSELVVAALLHDGVEDQSVRIYIERIKRKQMIPESIDLEVNNKTREDYKDIFTSGSFKEIKDRFGLNVENLVRNMTNHDFDSLAEDLNLAGDAKRDFINKMYAEHVEDIINKPDLFTLKLADLSTNIDLQSLEPSSLKYQKLKRKYKSVIETILKRIESLETDHPLYSSKEKISRDLNKIYLEQYS